MIATRMWMECGRSVRPVKFRQISESRTVFPHRAMGDLEAQIRAFIEHYNHHCYQESRGNVTPADADLSRASDILAEPTQIKRPTL
jgi:hypothetical protein